MIIGDVQSGLAGLLALLVGFLFLYRGLARPIRQLSTALAVRDVEYIALHPLPAAGPTEVVALTDEINRRAVEHAGRRRAAIVESSNDAIIAKTLSGVITDWNPAAERLYGYTAAEAAGKPISILVPPGRDDEVPALLERIARGEDIALLQTVRQRKDGALVDISVSFSPTRDAAGRIIGASAIARDVTERVRERAALAALHNVAVAGGRLDHVRLVALTIEQIKATIGVDAAFVEWWDPAAQRLRPVEGPGSLGSIAIDPSETQRRDEGLAGLVFERGTPVVVDDYASWPMAVERFRHTVGSVVGVPMIVGDRTLGVLSAVSLTRRAFSERDVHLLTLFASEVTPAIEAGRLVAQAEARRTEAEASEARFSAYFQASPVPSLIVRRADNTHLDVNQAFVDLVGHTREELIGRRPVEVGYFLDPREALDLLERLEEQAQVKGELRIRRKDDEIRTVLAFVQPTVIAGEACVVIGSFDLTDQRRAAALEQRQQVIEEATRAKSAFLANMSHELRTPLNAILGFSKLLLEQLQLDDRHREYLQNVRDAGAQLLDLINDVLDIARVESGKLQLRRERVALATVLEPALAAARLAAETRGLRFEVDGQADAVVYVDPGRLRQILNNLLSNAVKFSGPGGQVRLSTQVTAETLAIQVSDTGVGIPKESHDRVFGTFERLHEGRVEATGTGLGLALTKQLVELHGGTIDFESAVGVGTTFRVQLPNPAHEPVVGERVLVVEDDRRDADLVVALARGFGLRTEVVASLADAVVALRRHRPLGLVLDLRLPDGRGEAVLAALRAVGEPPVPTIVVTLEDSKKDEDLGVDDFLTKPISVERLNRWLAGIAAKEETRANPPR